jgi:hypothetical protein
MTSTLLSPTAAVPSRRSKDGHVKFFVAQSYEIVLPHALTFDERIRRGGFHSVSSDVNEQNFPLDSPNGALKQDLRVQVVIASMDNQSNSPHLTTENIIGGIHDTDFSPGVTAVHLEASTRYEGLLPDQAIVSLGTIANNWRGQDSQKSALVTRNYLGTNELTNCLLTEARSWNRDWLMLLFKIQTDK